MHIYFIIFSLLRLCIYLYFKCVLFFFCSRYVYFLKFLILFSYVHINKIIKFINVILFCRDDDILYISSGENFISINKICSHNQLNRNSEWITLNVGGQYFTTTRNTLTKKEPMSMLARYFIYC